MEKSKFKFQQAHNNNVNVTSAPFIKATKELKCIN